MRKLLLAVCFITFAITGISQNFIVEGKVTSELNGLPMPAASVFAQNTTIGTATDAEGNFKIYLPAGGYDLIITYTGYKTESVRITTANANEKINISLKEKEKELETIAIVASNEVTDGLAKYGAFFKDQFIGKSKGSAQCFIQNPDVLHFFFSKKRNRLKITATEPLIVKNEALGYNIKYSLDSFTYEYNNEITIYSGYPLYETLVGDSAQNIIWENNRREAYKGSMLHFMRSVYNKILAPEEFEIQFIVKNGENEKALKLKDPYGAFNYTKDDSLQTVEIMPNQRNMGILFTGAKPDEAYLRDNPSEPSAFRFSTLMFKPEESIVIEQNGYFYDQNDVTISGYWTWDKVAAQLPFDYIYTP